MATVAPIITAIASIATVGTAIYSGVSEKDAADDAARAQEDAAFAQEQAAYESELLADENARNIESETLEGVRRESLDLQQQQDERRAKAAASGLVLDDKDSSGLVINEAGAEGNRQIDWLKASGYNRAAIERWQGDISRNSGLAQANLTSRLADNTRRQGTNSLIRGIGSAIGSASQASSDINSLGVSQKWWTA